VSRRSQGATTFGPLTGARFVRENAKFEREIVLPDTLRDNVFGVPLEALMGEHGEKGGIPRVVKDCVEFIRERGNVHPPPDPIRI
jgi:hypothetical protein